MDLSVKNVNGMAGRQITSTKIQNPKINCLRFGIWDLEFIWNLEFGACNLSF